ncbi:hypothetical protein Taro_013611 [Colocasia esculenta]|uniref:Glycosyltransferase n=1 Tax=Colocasia esculenta TaxID=4460 RepID=A0A843UGZ9_COLES|nr:hypothetical protein [Colocasia esculenta]
MAASEKVLIVFLPTPGIGHLISIVEAARRLLEYQPHFSALVLTMAHPVATAWRSTVDAYVDSVRRVSTSSGLDISFEELPSVEGPPFKEDMRGETFISLLVECGKPHFKAAIGRRAHVAAVVVDLFCTTMIDVADELGLPSYIFFTSTAALIGLMLHMPALELAYPAEMTEVEGNIVFPGFRHTMPPHFMPSFMMDKKNEAYRWLVHHGRQFPRAKGIIANTFAALEPGPLRALEDGLYLADRPTPPVYSIGPVISLEKKEGVGRECLAWLDGQPPSSVVYICFGSMGRFSAEQTREIAVGLERSGHRFLWALRSPSHSRFRETSEMNLEEILPEGFLERMKGRGMVWPAWAPQADVLGHPATGGFVTHCGWNSCLESLWFGVPMLAWPLYAEQHLNAFEMAREMGVAVGELGVAGGLVSGEEVERGVRLLMGEEGRKARCRAEEMKAEGRRALEAAGGSSFASMTRLAGDILSRQPPPSASSSQ